MTTTTYIFGIAAALLILVVIVELLRRKGLRERHAFWWLGLGTFSLVIALFPRVLDWMADLVGISVPINLVFFLSIITLFLVSVQHSTELTKLESKTRTLAEQVTLLSMRVQELEDASELSPEAGQQDRQQDPHEPQR